MNVFTASDDTSELTGSVKWYSITRGYGFVTCDDSGEEALLHENTLRDYGLSHIPENSRVRALFNRNEKGLQIKKVLEAELPEGAGVIKQGDVVNEGYEDEDFVPARVKWFDHGRGYGFVNLHHGSDDYFLHVEVLRKAGIAKVSTGEALSVVVTNVERGAVVHAVGLWNKN